MLGLGIPEMVLIMIAALLIFGPKRLPEIGQSVGKAMREFKKGVNDIKDNFENVIPEDIQPGEAKVDQTSPVSATMNSNDAGANVAGATMAAAQVVQPEEATHIESPPTEVRSAEVQPEEIKKNQ